MYKVILLLSPAHGKFNATEKLIQIPEINTTSSPVVKMYFGVTVNPGFDISFKMQKVRKKH